MTENEVFEHISDLAGDYKCFDEKISHQESLILCNLIKEIQQYRAIGTVEELRVAREKQIARKTEVIDKFYDEVRKCPSCGDIVEYYGKEFYCEKCGQKLKWGD